MDIEIINKVAEILTQNGSKIVEEYTQWFVVSSIAWIICFIVFGLAALKIKTPESFDMNDSLIKTIVIIFCIVIILVNVIDLIAPEAAAIHRILKDLN